MVATVMEWGSIQRYLMSIDYTSHLLSKFQAVYCSAMTCYNSGDMQSVVDQIREKIDIAQYIGQYVQLKRAGRNLKGLCPFHEEKSGSFIVSPERQIWHCFGACGVGGDVISFAMKYDNLTFTEAVTELAKSAGIQLSQDWGTQGQSEKDSVLTLNEIVAKYYHYILVNSPIAETARTYLTGRSIRKEIWETFRLGYAPDSWDSLYRYLRTKKVTNEQMNVAGLALQGKNGNWYDRFRGRLIFPIQNMQGKVVGFSGRVLSTGEKEAKYINSPETPAYHKRQSLFGIQLAKDAIRKQNFAIIVEGEFDMITPYQHGVSNIVAIKGSAMTAEHFSTLKRLTNRIYLCLDADEAGIEATRRAITEADGTDMEIHVMSIEDGKDPDEAIRQNPLAFTHAIEKSMPVYDFLIDTAVHRNPPSDPFSKKHIADEVIPLISRIRNPIIQSYYIKRTSDILSVSEESVQKTMRQYWQQQRNKFTVALRKEKIAPVSIPREQLVEQYLLSLLLQSENTYELFSVVNRHVLPEYFMTAALGKIYQQIGEYQKDHAEGFIVKDFIFALPSELRTPADTVFLFASSTQSLNNVQGEKLALEMKRNALRRVLQQKSGAIDVDLTADEVSNQILSELKAVEKRLLEV